MNVQDHAERLTGLAVGLCLDADIRVCVQPHGWCWDPVSRTIFVGAVDLGNRGADYCAGVLAHEVGHYHISRYHLFHVDFPSRQALSAILNGIEDPRVNTWIRRRYPGTAAWFARLREVDACQPCNSPLPAVMRFAVESAREELLGWQPAWSIGEVPPVVRQALEQTAVARRVYAELLPSPSLCPEETAGQLQALYRNRVIPELTGERVPLACASGFLTAWEQSVRVRAAEALEVARHDILPAVMGLWQADVEHLAASLAGDSQRQALARRGLARNNTDDLTRVVVDAFGKPGRTNTKRMPDRWMQMARQVLERWLDQVRSPAGRLGGRPIIAPADGKTDRKAQPATSGEMYQKARSRVSNQVEILVREMERIIRPRRRLAARSGFPTGQKLDLRKAMAFDADPRRYDRLWQRPSIPQRRDTAFLLLVDLSGSMRGNKTEAALAGTLLLAESLSRVETPFAVYGFQDVLIPLCGFDTTLTPAVRSQLASLPEEVAGTRPGGNNCPSYNDDGPCLREAAEELLSVPARGHVLIVVSDGQPEGRRSRPEDLKQAVSDLTAMPRLRLVGIGLGPGTEHVRDYYPESIASVPPEDLAGAIAGLLRQAIGT